ncbi:MAG: hypothetical protein U1E76_16270 [Planctomycetota bacterium]
MYVAKQDSTAELRPVTLGQRQGDQIVVDGSVAPGERVVVAGQLGITPGGKVIVEQAATPRQPQGAPKEGKS